MNLRSLITSSSPLLSGDLARLAGLPHSNPTIDANSPKAATALSALRHVDLLEINSSESVRRAQNSPAGILYKYLSAFQDVHGQDTTCATLG